MVVGDQELRRWRSSGPPTRIRRPDFHHAAEAGEGPDQPERHDQREERQLAPDHARELAAGRARSRRPARSPACRARRRPPARYWRSATVRRRPAERSPRPIRIAAVTATGVPKPAAPSKKAPKAEGDQQQLQAPVRGDVRDAVLQHLERAVLLGQPVQEDDVEHDPADRQQAEGGAVAARPGRPSWPACRTRRSRRAMPRRGRSPRPCAP